MCNYSNFVPFKDSCKGTQGAIQREDFQVLYNVRFEVVIVMLN